MTMTIPEQPEQTPIQMVPGTQLSLTDRDVRRLDSTLETLELALHSAFTHGVDIPLISNPLLLAATITELRAVIEANGKAITVPAVSDSTYPRQPAVYYPTKTYTVRREIGVLHRLAIPQKWVWTIDSEVEMTGAEFHKFDIPTQIEDQFFITRCRIKLLDGNGMIVRERYGY